MPTCACRLKTHIDKIQGLEHVYKTCELLHLLPIGFGMEPYLSLYADVYLLGVHCHSFNPTPWELSSTRVQACQGSCWTLVFEFHDKRHIMEFYLARKELRQSNGAIGTTSRTWPVFVPLVS